MAFHVTTETTNGYRCSCCLHTWDNTEWYDDLEEALDEVPVEMPKGTADWEVRRVSVVDGATGEEVAWAKAHWSTGYEKYSGYWYTCWSGYRPDTGGFEVVYDRNGEKVDKTWKEVCDELARKRYEKEVSKAQRELDEAQKRLDNLQG